MYKYFKFPTFWPGHLEALLPVLHGNDVFCTWQRVGKSLFMFLAPLTVSESVIRVIISPLIALMEQQV